MQWLSGPWGPIVALAILSFGGGCAAMSALAYFLRGQTVLGTLHLVVLLMLVAAAVLGAKRLRALIP